jgi:hypothetical protein
MTKLEKIEYDIASLNKADIKKISKWLDEYNADLWDKQIEDDAASGKLDKLVSAAKAQAAAGRVGPLRNVTRKNSLSLKKTCRR